MRRSSKRLLMMIASLPLLLMLLGAIYQLGMQHLEGNPRSYWASIEWAAETLTTTGYGHDNEWTSPFMQGFVVMVQFLGLFLVFLIFPVFLIPLFEERFEGRLPKTAPKLRDHVVVYRWGPAVTTLVDELDHAKVPTVIFEEDPAIARRLFEAGRHVVFTNINEDSPDLSSLSEARGVVANGSDHQNAVFIMSARRQGFEGPIVSLAENPKRRNAMTRVGATAVFTPKHALAAAIAAKASIKITPRISGAPMLGDKIEVGEVRIDANSSLAEKTLADSGIGAKTGASVIGQWDDGNLVAALPSTRLERGAILLAAGSQDSMKALARLGAPMPQSGPFLICGYGSVGKKVAQFLGDAGEDVLIIDSNEREGVTHVGDALDPDHLIAAGVKKAQAVVLTLGDDSETVFAAAVVRDLAPDTVIIASAKRATNVPRIRRAGADFGFSVGQVAAQLVVFQLLGEQSMSVQPKFKIVKTRPGTLVGKSILSAQVRDRTGCSVIGVVRGDDVLVVLEGVRVEADDSIYISGTQEAVDSYLELFAAK